MSEAEFDIDAASEAFDAARRGEAEAGEEAPPNHPESNEEPPQGDTPPGFKTYDEWVEDGNDPEDYVGKKAYERQYQNIQDNKDLKGRIKSMEETVQLTHDSTQQMLKQQADDHRKELESALHQAREDEDVDAAIEAQRDLDQHDADVEQQQAQPAQYREPEAIQSFRSANPILDPQSEQFDQDFNADIVAIYNTLSFPFTKNGTQQPTDAQMKRCLTKAMKDARELHADKFESPRNTRQQPGQQRQPRRAASETPAARAEDFKIDNPRNGRDHDASGVRDMVRQTAEKAARKAGKSEAEVKAFVDEHVSNFEASLNRE